MLQPHITTEADFKRCLSLLDYAEDEGKFIWKPRLNCPAFHYAGLRAGSLRLFKQIPYWRIGFVNDKNVIRNILEHKLVMYVHTGIWMTVGIIHKDRNTLNNRFSNLEMVGSQALGRRKNGPIHMVEK